MSASGTPIAAYTWGSDLISEHRYDTTTAESLWYLYGPQGETRCLTNSSGAVTDSYVYSPYGQLIASSAADPNPFRYGGAVGYYSDSDTGLILCGERWYDPSEGRWLNSDPIGYDGGSDLYAYCGDNPVYWVDPSGEKKVVIYIGDTTEEPMIQWIVNWGVNVDVNDMTSLMPSKGYTVTVIRNADKNEVLSTIPNYDGAVFIGHGDPDASYAFEGPTQDVRPGDIAATLKGKQLDFAILHSCHTNTPAWRNATVGNHPDRFYGSTGLWDPVLSCDLAHPLTGTYPTIFGEPKPSGPSPVVRGGNPMPAS